MDWGRSLLQQQKEGKAGVNIMLAFPNWRIFSSFFSRHFLALPSTYLFPTFFFDRTPVPSPPLRLHSYPPDIHPCGRRKGEEKTGSGHGARKREEKREALSAGIQNPIWHFDISLVPPLCSCCLLATFSHFSLSLVFLSSFFSNF